jgi:HEPN domain-containing protein
VKDAVSFHCQQAAEKFLKALLRELGLPIPRTHDLDQLLVLLLPHHGFLAPLKRILVSLSHYAAIIATLGDQRRPGRCTPRYAMRSVFDARFESSWACRLDPWQSLSSLVFLP